jgi:TonB family protein
MQTEVIEWKSSREWAPWGISAAIHCVVMGWLVLLPPGQTAATPARAVILMPLIYRPPVSVPRPLQLARPLREPPVKVVALTAPEPENIPQPVVKQFQAFVRERPKAIAIQAPEQVRPVEASLAPAKLATPDLPARLAPAAPVKTNVFASSSGTSPDGHIPASHLDVHTGGFGGVDGSPVRSGGGKGNGAAVHTGGFGDSNGSGGSGSGNGKPAVIASAGFGNATVQSPAARKTEAATPSETPVEVLWKPKPVYTDEARARKLEGNVTLEVIFRATGQVEVLRVTRGLGYGLDQSARTAAEQIRFRPGKKDGVPVDRTGLVLITFELS